MEIKCKRDLYNQGKCFTKNEIYKVNSVRGRYELENRIAVNDLGEKHRIGHWWNEFEIIT